MKEFRIAKCLCYAGTEYAEVKKVCHIQRWFT